MNCNMGLCVAFLGLLLVAEGMGRPVGSTGEEHNGRRHRHLMLAADPLLPDPGGNKPVLGAAATPSNPLPVTAFEQTADDEDCIDDPEKFIKAWRSPNPRTRDRCVDSSIVVRLANGDKAFNSLSAVLDTFYQRLQPLSFWAFKDAPEKYLRIGIPQSVGSYIDRNPSQNNNEENAPWADPAFPGVRRKSNGVSLLTQIGFGADFYRVDRFYMMFVGKRDKTYMSQKGVPTFVPTWENVRIYYENYIREYIASQNGAFGKPEDFSIPPEVVSGGSGFKGLANIDLSELTGCPSQCTFEDRNYPDLDLDGADKYPALTPGIFTNHTAKGNKCTMPVILVKKNPADNSTEKVDIGAELFRAGRLRVGEPTQLNTFELSCTDPDWSRYFLVGDFPSTPTWQNENGTNRFTGDKFPGLFELCNKEAKFSTGPRFMAGFLNEWNKLGAADIKKKAVMFRAFLMSGCAGNFNQLFSGNGLIYTGHGGVSGATVHELIMGQLTYPASKNKITGEDQLLGNYGYAFFCIDGTERCCPNNDCKALAKPAWE